MSLSPAWRPMPLLLIPTAFDHPEWVFELKHDGFRALAIIERASCQLVSRNGHVFKQWPQLAAELARTVPAASAVLDGEVTCIDSSGGSDFRALLFRRARPVFYAFDALSIDGQDLCGLPLIERKARLRAIVPRTETRLRLVDHVEQRGADLFRAACSHDCEGVVGKWSLGPYRTDGRTTSWVKVKNPSYTQVEGRRELFEQRRSEQRRSVRASYRLDAALTAKAW